MSDFTMPTLRMKTPALGSSAASPNHHHRRSSHDQAETTQAQIVSQYEQSREDRIRENLERMKKLGIVGISLQLKANLKPKRSAAANHGSTTPSDRPLIRPAGPVRRSSRLQNATPVSYSDAHLEKEDRAVRKKNIRLEVGAKPEIYTEEDENKLGNTDKSWTLFVDGYGKDGKRIYDPVTGKTCHQCRQKTLGYHTDCSQCGKVQGQFCGDCLYMRYGEHVLEAIENPDWICPACRGICNCSFCRTAKGWPPTGMLYKKVSALGYKSVAHYLIQTQRSQTGLGESPESTNQVSAKRSLHFPDVDASCKETLKDDHNDIGMTEPVAAHKVDDEFKSETENDRQISADADTNNQTSAKRSLSFPDMEQLSENSGPLEADHKVDPLELSKPQSESCRADLKGEKDDAVNMKDIKLGDGSNALGTSSKSKRNTARDIKPSTDCIAGRLRQRRRKGTNDHDEDLDVQILSEKEVEELTGVLFTDTEHDGDSGTAFDKSSKLKKKRAFAAEPSSDSIGGRLRQRRKSNCYGDEVLTVNDANTVGNNFIQVQVAEGVLLVD